MIDFEKMNHAQLTFAYYQEKLIDKATFDLLHSKLEVSKHSINSNLPTIEQRVQMLEERMDSLQEINIL